MKKAAILLLAPLSLMLGAAHISDHQGPDHRGPNHRGPNNRAIITEFARLFYVERDVRRAFETYVAPGYIQHNPGVADGREAAVALLAPMFADRVKTFTIQRIVVDGDMAVIHIHVRPTTDSRGASVFDMYRLKNGKIVEHWDAIQPVPEHSANPHPMF